MGSGSDDNTHIAYDGIIFTFRYYTTLCETSICFFFSDKYIEVNTHKIAFSAQFFFPFYAQRGKIFYFPFLWERILHLTYHAMAS